MKMCSLFRFYKRASELSFGTWLIPIRTCDWFFLPSVIGGTCIRNHKFGAWRSISCPFKKPVLMLWFFILLICHRGGSELSFGILFICITISEGAICTVSWLSWQSTPKMCPFGAFGMSISLALEKRFFIS